MSNDLDLSDICIYCLCETWRPDGWSPPSHINDFSVFLWPAYREKITGRYKEGLAVFYPNKYCELFAKSNTGLFILVKTCSKSCEMYI